MAHGAECQQIPEILIKRILNMLWGYKHTPKYVTGKNQLFCYSTDLLQILYTYYPIRTDYYATIKILKFEFGAVMGVQTYPQICYSKKSTFLLFNRFTSNFVHLLPNMN